MQKSETGTEIKRQDVERILKEQPDISDPALLLRLASAASLLEVGDYVRYTHQLVQEYFASEVMGVAMDAQRDPTEFWPEITWWEPQGWEETAIILAGVRDDPQGVARWIAPAQPEMAYQVLMECGIDVSLDEIAPETRKALADGAKAKVVEKNPIGRASAYRVLGLVQADNRRGIDLRTDGVPDIDWVEIPAGEFIYQENVQLALPAFCIARYPITYAQFQAFLDAPNGFQNSSWWFQLAERPSESGEQAFKISNHPREAVSWYDAVAFCRWLSAELGYEVRLPTEQEWEKAARGTQGYLFPYGNEFDAQKCNTDEIGIKMTTAVGIFPDGASPYGVLDMCGNVWEWCLNEYSNPNNIEINGIESRRTVRGGTWKDGQYFARSIHRDTREPSYRSTYGGGFRIASTFK
jgi:hypothetical protein